MRKLAILASLFIYFSANSCLGELLRSPLLVAHFIEHRENNKDISFYTFIYQHYQDDDGDDADNDRDMQLPFKSTDSSHSNTVSAAVPLISPKTNLSLYSLRSHDTKAAYREENIPSPYLSRILHPPRLA